MLDDEGLYDDQLYEGGDDDAEDVEDDEADDDWLDYNKAAVAVARPLKRQRRVPTPSVVLVLVAVVLGAIGVLAELQSSKTQTWTAAHPVAVTLGAGLILLVLTVLAVERWVALNESKRWRTPALTALAAYVQQGFAAHGRIQRAVNDLPGAKHQERISDTDHALHVKRAVEGLMTSGSFFALHALAHEEMAQLETIVLLTVQTVARHEPFEPVIGSMSEQQGRLSSIAKDAEYLACWAQYPGSVPVSTPEEAEDVWLKWVSEANEAAERMEKTFFSFWLQLDLLQHQVDQALHPIKPRGSKPRTTGRRSWLHRPLWLRRPSSSRRDT